MTLAPGIHTIPPDAYHQDPCDTPSLSSSIAKLLIASSPAHAKAAHPRLTPQTRDDDPKFDVGNASHRLFLEGDNAVDILAFTDWRTKDAKEARELSRQHGRIAMLGPQWDECDAMVRALREQLEQRADQPPLFRNGTAEQTLVWQEQGVWCRARLDYLHDDLAVIDDLKTTRHSANPETFSKTLYTSGYHIQARMYQRAVAALHGSEPDFRFCVVETTAPYAISVLSLAPAGVALADAQIDYALATWKRCLERDEWPAYTDRICYAEPPGWAEAAWLEREAMVDAA